MAPTHIDDSAPAPWWRADWGPAVSAVFSDRAGGHSVAPFAACNLGDHVGDDPAAVALNRRAFEAALGAPAVLSRFSRLLIDRPHARVLRVIMNRPDKLNAVDGEMHRELTEVWRVIDADASVNAVLLTGAGRAFSAGGDLDLLELGSFRDIPILTAASAIQRIQG